MNCKCFSKKNMSLDNANANNLTARSKVGVCLCLFLCFYRRVSRLEVAGRERNVNT